MTSSKLPEWLASRIPPPVDTTVLVTVAGSVHQATVTEQLPGAMLRVVINKGSRPVMAIPAAQVTRFEW